MRGERYRAPGDEALADLIETELHYFDFDEACSFYAAVLPHLSRENMALLGCNDRYFLLTVILGRKDAINHWLYARCREVEAEPDGYLDLWAREHYKAVDVDEIVATPSGWARHGDLKPGDWVFGPDGVPARVLARTPVFTDADCYRVTFDDGYSVVVSGEHLWTVEQVTRKRVAGTPNERVGRELVTLDTREMAARDHSEGNRLSIRATTGLQMPAAILPIEPYTLGAWLGDGSCADGRITCADPEIFEAIRAEGYELSHNQRAGEGAETRTVYGLRPLLRAGDILGDKRIPMAYMRGSEGQRFALLRGLMDTDGHCNTRGTATFVNKNQRLARDVFDLAAGLGMKPRLYTFDQPHGRVYQVAFQAYGVRSPFSLTRKKTRCKSGVPIPRRFVVSVAPVDSRPVSCIQVDRRDGLYLIGRDLVATHNSTIITFTGIIQELMINPDLTVGMFSFNQSAARKFLKQIMQEFEKNELLRATYPDVIWDRPRQEAPLWSQEKGIVLRRATNPKEASVEAHGLVEGLPTGPHYSLMVYDDVVTMEGVTNDEQVKKVTEHWEMSDNLGAGDVRKWYIGTRYSFSDTYGIMMARKAVKPRIYPATDNGKVDGKPVFMSEKRWLEKVNTQRTTLAAQMLQNPIAGQENMFMPGWFKGWEVRPSALCVYIMGDPSKGRSASSDRTAIAVVGIDGAGNKYLLDGFRHRMSLSERWQALKLLYGKWSTMRGVQVCQVGYEAYGLQADIEYFKERMTIEGTAFSIRELNWTRDGTTSKADRVGRLEPDFRLGRFCLPALVYRAAVVDPVTKKVGPGDCLWSIDEDQGKIIERKMREKTASMVALERLGEHDRVAKPIRRLDENRKVYDVTEALMEEMLFFPFAPHDDLVDALARIYDMEPVGPSIHEDAFVEAMSERQDFVDA